MRVKNMPACPVGMARGSCPDACEDEVANDDEEKEDDDNANEPATIRITKNNKQKGTL